MVIQDSQDKILLTKRSLNLVLGGSWILPGGHIEPGETLEDGVVREISEETGIDIQIEIRDPSSSSTDEIKMTFNDQPVNVRPYFAVESSIARTKNKMWNMNLCPIGHLIVYFEVDHSGRSEPRRPPAGRGGRSRCPVADLATRDRARHTSDPTPARTPQQGTAESPRGLPQGGHDGDLTSKTVPPPIRAISCPSISPKLSPGGAPGDGGGLHTPPANIAQIPAELRPIYYFRDRGPDMFQICFKS